MVSPDTTPVWSKVFSAVSSVVAPSGAVTVVRNTLILLTEILSLLCGGQHIFLVQW